MQLIFGAVLGSLVCVLAGCGKRESTAAAGIRTGTLLVGNAAEPGDLDPHLASILNDQIVVNTLFEGLTLLDERTTNPLPAVAESWTTSVTKPNCPGWEPAVPPIVRSGIKTPSVVYVRIRK